MDFNTFVNDIDFDNPLKKIRVALVVRTANTNKVMISFLNELYENIPIRKLKGDFANYPGSNNILTVVSGIVTHLEVVYGLKKNIIVNTLLKPMGILKNDDREVILHYELVVTNRVEKEVIKAFEQLSNKFESINQIKELQENFSYSKIILPTLVEV